MGQMSHHPFTPRARETRLNFSTKVSKLFTPRARGRHVLSFSTTPGLKPFTPKMLGVHHTTITKDLQDGENSPKQKQKPLEIKDEIKENGENSPTPEPINCCCHPIFGPHQIHLPYQYQTIVLIRLSLQYVSFLTSLKQERNMLSKSS